MEYASFGEYWNIYGHLGVSILPENVMYTFFKECASAIPKETHDIGT